MSEPKAGQTKDEFISQCISVLIDEGYENEQASAICFNKWELKSQNKLKEWELDGDFNNVFAMGIVDEPAIEYDFVSLNKDRKKITLNEEQQLIVGPAMVPHKLILDADGKYSEFTKESIKLAAHNFFIKNNQSNININHQRDVDECYVVESWIVENKEDKINTVYGFNLPKGTWCLAVKVKNEKVWEMIKNKELNGFSIEAYVKEIMTKLSKPGYNEMVEMLNKIIDHLKNK